MKDILIDFDIELGFRKVWKWKWWIGGLLVVAAVVSFLLASMIKPEYRSTAAFIPPDISSLKSMVFTSGLGYRGFEAAEEEDIDRTVDYLNSLQVIDSIAVMYGLYEHYGIDKANPKADEWFYHAYSTKNLISFSDRSTVQITTFDVDPQYAADIANTYLQFAIDFFENIAQRKSGLAAAEDEMNQLSARREKLVDSLANMRTQYKLYHIDHVGEGVDQILSQAIRNSPEFNKNYDRMLSCELQLNWLEERSSDLEREYVGRKQNMEQYPLLIQITQRAKPSTFKARPKRSIIVAAAMAGTLAFAIFMVLLLDRKKAV
ncbi:MAG: hypothetical protein H6581_17980 [Bacteroidia bacterium]|nr:hypothetical protein [Bacteroidia bacterium]